MFRHVKSALPLAFVLLGAPMALAQGRDNDHAPRRLASWTSDRREYAVGDIITVLVSEATLASATKTQTGSDQQTRANDVGINPPKIGTTALPTIDADISMNKSSASKQNGAAQRGVNFRGDISVRVVAVDRVVSGAKHQACLRSGGARRIKFRDDVAEE